MAQKKLLFIGFGDIATRASQLALAEGYAVTGIARSERTVPPSVDYWRGAIGDSHIIQQLRDNAFDVAVITLTSSGRREKDYQQTYEDNSRQLVRLWQNEGGRAPGLVIFVSSTSVYHQSGGERVDENSPTTPPSPTAQRLLAAEQLWLDSALNACVVRFSGIYGPGRDYLLRQVMAGEGGPREDSPYTNRIHVDDGVGVLLHLCRRYQGGEPLESIYLASDDEPAPSWEVRSWLAEQMGYGAGHLQPTPETGRGGNKRCNNARLRASGYEFKYPDYRSGYLQVLSELSS